MDSNTKPLNHGIADVDGNTMVMLKLKPLLGHG